MDDEQKVIFKKLNSRATMLKMNLHDLAEDLPTGWEKIPEIAGAAFQAFKELAEFKKKFMRNIWLL